MTNILVLRSSILGDASASNRLVQETLDSLSGTEAVSVIERDLVAKPVPYYDADAAQALRGGTDATPAQTAARALSDELIAEVQAADVLLIGAPMYNFSISTQLRSWFDYVLRAGVTFRYTEKGPEGLLKGKRAIVVLTRGGLYSEGPARPMDSQEPYLRTLLGFIGITDVTFVRAEKLGFGPEARESAIQGARARIDAELRPVLASVA